MKNLSSQKLLLIAENNLSRDLLTEEFTSLGSGIHQLTGRADSYKAVVSSTALVLTGLAAFQRGRNKHLKAKSSWLNTLVKGAGLVSTLWLAFQQPGRDR